MLESFRASIGFLTVIPLGMERVEKVGSAAWNFPLVGAFVGLLASIVALGFAQIFPREIASLAALVAIYLLSGFHHLDGFLDWADASMLKGSKEKKLEAMHDLNYGVGALASGFILLFAGFLALKHGQHFLPQLVVAEASAKFSMVLASYTSRSTSHPGMGSAFAREIRGNHLLFAGAVFLYIPFLALTFYRAPYVLLAALLLTLGMVKYSERSLGGLSGDVLGATNEIVRTAVLLVVV